MSINERINNDLKEAMKSGDKPRLMALRDIKSKLLLEITKEGGDGAVDDSRSIAILNKLYKQRLESIEIYKTQQRQDLVEEELSQAHVIKAYLPEMLEGAALEKIIRTIVGDVGASSLADLGKVMGAATKQLAGKAEGKAIAEMVKKVLAGA